MEKSIQKLCKKKSMLGITLVALVVTIVVLLILAGITITFIMGDNSVFKLAKEAKEKTEEAKKDEQEYMGNLGNDIDNYLNGNNGGTGITKPPADFIENPDKYKHPDQSDTNGDRAVGTDGKAVNMDLWTYVIIDEEKKYVDLRGDSSDSSNIIPAYLGDFTEEGKIYGTVPQYIKIDGKNGLFTVTGMDNTFCHTALKVAPVIPKTVTNLNCTFFWCYDLTYPPTIPENVECMRYTFDSTSIISFPDIPAKVTDITQCYYCVSNSLERATVTIHSPYVTEANAFILGWNTTIRVPANSITYNTISEVKALGPNGGMEGITIEQF